MASRASESSKSRSASSAPRLKEVDERAPLLSSSHTTVSSSTSCEEDGMEKVRRSRFARFVDKLAVESEHGLTNAQLMLANPDLKPVEPKRRQCKFYLSIIPPRHSLIELNSS